MTAREHVVQSIAGGFNFLEGPRWHKGQLYFADFYGGRVHVLDEGNQVRTICQLPQWVSGIGFAPNGDLLAVAVEERKVLRQTSAGTLVEAADLTGHTKFRCNDMLVDAKGRAYVGHFGFDMTMDIGPTNLFLVSPQGKVTVAADGLVFPNGMALSADGKTLIVAETFASRLSAFDVAEDGSLSGHRIWATLGRGGYTSVQQAVDSREPLPDGICLDVEGAVWIGDAGGRGALRIAPGGEILDRVSTQDMAVFAPALGGHDRKTLYLCAAPPLLSNDPSVEKAGVLMSTRVDVPGV